MALRILVPYDASPGAEAALSVARQLSGQLGHQIHLLHVADAPGPMSRFRSELGLPPARDSELAFSVRVGEPAEQICEEAASEDVALVTMATHASAETTERPLASVSHAATVGCRAPMVLVRPDLVSLGARPLRRLLLPLDGSPTTARALRAATQLAAELVASIELLYVAGGGQAGHEPGGMAAPRYIDQPHHEWPHWGQELVDRLCHCLARCPESVPVDIFLTDGEPGPEIARFATEHDADGIVLVRRSQLEPGRGRILRHLIAETSVPVIVVLNQHTRFVAQSPTARRTA